MVPEIIDNEQLKTLLEDALDWAHSTGLLMRTPEHKDRSDVAMIAPFALFPSAFPRKLFEQAVSVQKAMQLLYFRIAWDYDFLMEAHKDVIKSDQFTGNLVQILKEVHAEGIRQKIVVLTQRADYMCHHVKNAVNIDEQYQLKQIEVNMIATSMGGLSQRVTELHRRMLRKAGRQSEAAAQNVPDNEPIPTLAEGLVLAWKEYGDPGAIMLTVIQEENQNAFDQRYVEYEVEKQSAGQINIERLTLTQCAERLRLSPGDHSLLLDDRPVAIVYFRAGYVPEDYPSEAEWNARRIIERSAAIKCPNIGLQLANTKKVQQVVASPGTVEHFFKEDVTEAVAIRRTFAGLWGLEHNDEATKGIIEDAIAQPSRYVLKPQLEGGGGNFFGADVADKLRDFTRAELAAHILMQRLEPLVVKNYLVRAFQERSPQLVNVVSELGIYGCLVGIGGPDPRVLHSRVGGHLLRTKEEHVNEGGVAVGAAVIDSPILF